jgi:hypothetical protein
MRILAFGQGAGKGVPCYVRMQTREVVMDPKACLLAAEEAITAQDKNTANDHLIDYAIWRANGGFEPENVVAIGLSDKASYRGDHFRDILCVYFRLTFLS